jgi:methyl-accepting chemotaxis protein
MGMAEGLSIKTTVVGAIAGVALISQLVSGVWQYIDTSNAKRLEIRNINEAVLQPVADLAARGIEGGNQMMLTDASAGALYQASKVLYLKASGMSAGAEKTAFTEAIPPQKVEFDFLGKGQDKAKLESTAAKMAESGFADGEYLYVVKQKLPGVKNGAEMVAVFSAEQLRSLTLDTLKRLAPLSLAVMALSVVLAYILGMRIAKPMSRLASQVEEVANSLDLTRPVHLSDAEIMLNKEAGVTAKDFNLLLDNLRATLRRVLDNTSQVNAAVGEMSGAAQGVASRTEQQSNAAAAMASAIEEMTANLSEIAGNARQVDSSARSSGNISTRGGEIIHNASREMRVISETVRNGAQAIEQLGKQSNEISDIVQVISDIADQTNLLALNAAIEAARAGETGRGFAVVADEVRKLAERTAQSTHQISDMIGAIQGSANDAVRGMEDAVKRVASGVDLADRAGDSITQISESAKQVLVGVEEITSALQQQSQASNEVSRHVESIAQMTEENSHAAGETAHAARHLENLARAMQEAVARFRV